MRTEPHNLEAGHTWSTIRPDRFLGKIPKSPVTKYDARFFGLSLPKRAFNIVKLLRKEILEDGTIRKGFESEEKAREEDKLRVKLLRAHGGAYEKYLADLLAEAEERGKPCPSLASAWWCRKFRVRILGEELKRLAPYANEELFFVTLINTQWKIPIGELRDWKARKIMESFRQHLNRSGTTNADGLLFSWLHGEYDHCARCYRLHVHAVMQGEKIERLRTLKGRWGYVSVDNDTKRPVMFLKITERARAISYAHQSFWPNRPRYYAKWSGKRHKSAERTRIPSKQHAEVLMWLFMQRPSDLLLTQPNIRIEKHRTR